MTQLMDEAIHGDEIYCYTALYVNGQRQYGGNPSNELEKNVNV